VKEYDGDDMYLKKKDKQQYLTMAAWGLDFKPWVGFSVWISSNPWLLKEGPGTNYLEVAGDGAFKGFKVAGAGFLSYLKPGYMGGVPPFSDGDEVFWISAR
jgi:hypothetical protein